MYFLLQVLAGTANIPVSLVIQQFTLVNWFDSLWYVFEEKQITIATLIFFIFMFVVYI